MSIGYACLAIAVPGSEMKTCTLKNASEERLFALIAHNLSALEILIDYNILNGIKLFRISSDLIPFGSSAARELPWDLQFAETLAKIGQKIRRAGMRVSLHPGQYTVLNAVDEGVASRAALDLDYHAKILTSLGLDCSHKLVLHLGGAYGDKTAAQNRFISRFKDLSDSVKERLILENDGSLFNIQDVLETAAAARIPVVYDNLHNATNPADLTRSDADWIAAARSSWRPSDGRQKIHYSQQHPHKSRGAHSDTIDLAAFLEFYKNLTDPELDIMLEVKDKNISALKCRNSLADGGIKALELEWARYKYSVLEKSPKIYGEIRQLLKDKDAYPALTLYDMLAKAAASPFVAGYALTAAEHVWGYFKDQATAAERRRFDEALRKFSENESALPALKRLLFRLAEKYHQAYLLQSYYFYL